MRADDQQLMTKGDFREWRRRRVKLAMPLTVVCMAVGVVTGSLWTVGLGAVCAGILTLVWALMG